jgi:hypothetical protein
MKLSMINDKHTNKLTYELLFINMTVMQKFEVISGQI